MKKIIYIFIFILLSTIIYASVTTKTEPDRKQITFSLKPGDRIVVIEAGATTSTVTVKPIAKKVLDYKVPNGKLFDGQLIEH